MIANQQVGGIEVPIEYRAQHGGIACAGFDLQHTRIAAQRLCRAHRHPRRLERVDSRVAIGRQRFGLCYHPGNEHVAIP